MAQVNYISAEKLGELLRTADPHGRMNVRVLTTNQLALGIDPLHPSSVIDLSKEVVRSLESQPLELPPSVAPDSKEPRPFPSARPSRTTGAYHLEIKRHEIICRSLKEMLAEGLRAYERHKPGTLQKLSQISPRSKHIVALDRNRLFEKADLVEKCTEKLVDDWWYGTNNSAQETVAWLKRGAELCGMVWDRDVIINL